MTPEMHGTAILLRMLSKNVDALLLRNRKGLAILMSFCSYAFFDESGKWQDRDFICLCGYLSDEDRWNKFQCAWKRACSEYEIDGLHLTEFYAEAAKKNLNTDEVLGVFSSIIRDNILVGFAVGLDAKHYRAMPQEARGALGDPATACLQRVLRLIRDRLVREKYDGRISITLDEEEGAVIGLYKSISRLRKSDPVLGHYIGAVCFADDAFVLPLQAADMLANLTARWFKDRNEGRASATEMPEPLKSLVLWPDTIYGLDYEHELWDAEDLDRELPKFLGRGTP